MGMNKGIYRWLLLAASAVLPGVGRATGTANLNQDAGFRPPAVPLIAFDPYLSVWSDATHLANHRTRFWNSAVQNLVSLVRINGVPYRLMGGRPVDIGALRQRSVAVFPTRTIYRFAGHGVALTLTFTTPRLPSNLKIFSLPITYLTWTVRSTDGRLHRVEVYYSTSSQLAVNGPRVRVRWQRVSRGHLIAWRLGAVHQDVLQSAVGIHWGYLYLAAPHGQICQAVIASNARCLESFVRTGHLPVKSSGPMPRRVADRQPVAAMTLRLDQVGAQPVSRWLMVGLDERWAINYYGQWLRPYWKRHGASALTMLAFAASQEPALRKQCATFDREVMADCTRVGGRRYARIAALAYRQAFAADALAADPHGEPYLCPFENTSGGDISTMDVIYPASPECLLFCPTLLKAMLVPVLNDSYPPHWPFPFAPHDLGRFPVATGHPHSGGETMPVEESGNMLILADAVSRLDGNVRFASRYWGRFRQWAEYLKKNGFDPGRQLCTDDFAGPIAHDANLSVKAIIAIGAYGQMCRLKGQIRRGQRYLALARRWAEKWMVKDADRRHYDLAFGARGTWSQKYNLIWDRVLRLHLFPPSVAKREIAFYLRHLQLYGLPLDSRKLYTKTDWTIWTAALARNPAHFRRLVGKVYEFLNRTPDRVPLADFYWTQNAHQAGMFARPVMGAAFMPLLLHRRLWKKWSTRGASTPGDWVKGLPPRPVLRTVVAAAIEHPVTWRYTLHQPHRDWYQPGFNDHQWKQGSAGFGTPDPGVTPRTPWTSDDIWLRRTFTMPAGHFPHLMVYTYHDEDLRLFINGVLAAKQAGYTTCYVALPIRRAALKTLKPGPNLFAAHVHQTVGGQFFDAGLVQVLPSVKKQWRLR